MFIENKPYLIDKTVLGEMSRAYVIFVANGDKRQWCSNSGVVLFNITDYSCDTLATFSHIGHKSSIHTPGFVSFDKASFEK